MRLIELKSFFLTHFKLFLYAMANPFRLLIFFIWVFTNIVSAQTVFADYKDGCLYVKTQKQLQSQLAASSPTRIPLSAFPKNLRDYLTSIGVQRIYRPFYQANEDPELSMVLRIEFSAIQRIQEAMDRLNASPGIVYAERIPLMKTDAVPNDPLWATVNGSTHLNQIGAQNAWNVFSGNSNITIAIVDNAVMWTHADLVQNTYTNTAEANGTPGVDDDANGYIDDINGWSTGDNNNNAVPTNSLMDHGTHCAGIAGARTDNTLGVASIGWNVKIIPVQAEPDNGPTTSVSYGYEGIVYAVKAKARIISCSWGGNGASATEQSVVTYAWNRGCIVMAAAGNANSATAIYPGGYTNVYCVAAVSPSDVKSTFSNYGNWVDIAAPGNNLLSTVPYTGTPVYVQKSGTSMATPLVAGLAGLILSKSPHMTRQDVLNCISSTAVNIYTLAANATYSASSALGAGRIDAYAAMLCAANYSAIPPVANFNALPRMTCPNTPIQFSDSSLYTPTNYTWTFSGGSPATSTLVNPLVTYSANGNYNVSLLVSNASGTHSITKTNYVQISGPQTLPFNEGFQLTAFPPLNWYAHNIYNDPIYFQRKTGVGAFGTSTACAMFDNYNLYAPGERDELRSPRMDFSNVNTAKLRFDVAFAAFNATFSDTLEVALSTDCGSTWTSIYLKGGSQLATAPNQTASQFTPTVNQWRTDSINISNWVAGQGNVMFSFINRGHYGQAYYLDNINLFFPSPTASLSAPSTACASNSIACLASGSIGGQYAWSCNGALPASGTGSVYNPSFNTPGTYTLSLLASNGNSSVNLTQTISIAASPTLSVSGASICSGQSTTLSVSGANSYTWSNGLNTSTIALSPPTTTVMSVTGSNGGSCTAQATVQILVNPQPSLSVTNATTCPGGTLTLTASGASSYSWNTGANSATVSVSPSVSTVYTVTGFNGTCSDTQTVSVSIGPALSVSISAPSNSICSGQSTTLTATGANTYSWSNNSTGNTIVVTPTTSFNFSVLGSSGTCTGTAVFSISVNSNPTVSLLSGNSMSLCANQFTTLTASGANSYTWSNQQSGSTLSLSVNASTLITVTGETNGCFDTQTLNITALPSPTLLITSLLPTNPTQTLAPLICLGDSILLSNNGQLIPGAQSYSWNNGSNSATLLVQPTITSVYSLTVGNGICTQSQTYTVTVFTGSPFSLSNQTVCAGSTNTLAPSPSGSYTFISVGNNTVHTGSNYTFTASNPMQYTVSTGLAQCAYSQTVSISIMSLNVSSSSNTLCLGQGLQLIASGAASYSWSSGQQSSSIAVTPSITSTYSVTGNSGNCTLGAQVSVTVFPNPNAVISTSNTACGNLCNGQMNAIPSGGTGPYTFSLSGTNYTSVPCNSLCAGLYQLNIRDSLGCTVQKYFSIASAPNAIQVQLTYTHASCANCPNGVISANPSGGTSPYSYTWTPQNSTLSVLSNLKPGCYTLTVSDAGGCTYITQQCISIATALEELLYTRNQTRVFPNPAVDRVFVESTDYEQLRIYNSLGQLVFEAKLKEGLQDFQTGLPEGVYTFVFYNTSGHLPTKIFKHILSTSN